MLKYMLLFVLITPLTGVIFMEMGAFSFASQEVGYANGATIAYLIYMAIFCLCYSLFNLKIRFPVINTLSGQYSTIAILTIIINCIFLFIILIPFGGYKVFLGQVDKGTFRISLGFFGSVAFLMTKLFLPSLLALNGFYFLKSDKTTQNKILLVLNFILAFIFGASWGFKSTAVFILMPSLLILYPKIELKKAVIFGAVILTSFVLFSMFFDNANNVDFNKIDIFAVNSDGNPIQLILYRITVLQGDTCWKVWDLFINNKLSGVSYSKTIWGIIGDGNLNRLFGVNTNDYTEFITYHFGLLLTFLCGNSPAAISEGYNVTGTVFSEGVIAGGKTGLVCFSAFAGVYTKIIKTFIDKGLTNNLPMLASVSSTYFCFNVFSWINGGGIETLFHISVLIGIILNVVFLTIIINISKKLKI